ncbi:hypothetical protein [Varibaculum vaginae]|uniref:hypothetical protein n=1 Tax=Varibaculum vaginae TaxID=2364797 RepID=UPI000F092602|nr:hypothetical protein [Varibaculum vaginae]
MSILRKISSFAATTLVAAAPLYIGFCSAPSAFATTLDTPPTSNSSATPASGTQNLNDWAKANCPGGSGFVNDTAVNTPIYLGYANGNTYLGYTNTTWKSGVDSSNQFTDTRTLKTINERGEETTTYKPKFGTCVRVASDQSGQIVARVYYGTLFSADKSALSASGFSDKTQTVFQVTKVKAWNPETKIESRSEQSGGTYQEMPHSLAQNSSDSGFKNTLVSREDVINLRFSQSGFYTINLKAITEDPGQPGKIYQAEMAYTFIVGKEAAIPQDLQDIVDGNSGEGSEIPPTPDPGENTPETPTPSHGDNEENPQPGPVPTPNPEDTTPVNPTPGHGDTGENSQSGNDSTLDPGLNPHPWIPSEGVGNENSHTRPNSDRKPTGTSTNAQSYSSPHLHASSRLDSANTARTGNSLGHAQLPQPLAGAFLTLPAPTTISADAGKSSGNQADSAAPKHYSANTNGSDSNTYTDSGSSLKFQADSTSTKQAAQEWVRSSSLAVFAFGLAASGISGIGLLAFSRMHP